MKNELELAETKNYIILYDTTNLKLLSDIVIKKIYEDGCLYDEVYYRYSDVYRVINQIELRQKCRKLDEMFAGFTKDDVRFWLQLNEVFNDFELNRPKVNG